MKGSWKTLWFNRIKQQKWKPSRGITVVLLWIGLFWTGNSVSPLVAIFYPTTDKLMTSTPRHYIIGELDTNQVNYLELSRTVDKSDTLKVDVSTLHDDFVRIVKRLFDKNYQVTLFSVTAFPTNIKKKPIEYKAQYRPQDRVDLKKFTQSKEFLTIYEKAIQDTAVRVLTFHIEGKQSHLTDVQRSDRLEKMGSIFVLRVELPYGKSDYRLRFLDKRMVMLEEKPFSFFYKPTLDNVLEDDGTHETSKFHTPAQENQCVSCHRMQPSEKERSNEGAVTRLCYPCHAWVTVGISVHPPLTDWTCFSCHTPPAEGKTGYPVPPKKVGSDVCYECHSDLQDLQNSAKVNHAPFESGDCLSCHNPHSSNQPKLLVADITSMCLYCHEPKYAKDHPVLRHPVDGRRDPLNPKKNFSCVSCHNPHASEHIKLFNRVSGKMQLCQECHKK